MSFLMFLAFVRVFMFLMAGGAAVMHFADPSLLKGAHATYFGANLLYFVALPCFVIGLWMEFSTKEHQAKTEEQVTGWLAWLLKPFKFIGRCFYNAWKVSPQ